MKLGLILVILVVLAGVGSYALSNHSSSSVVQSPKSAAVVPAKSAKTHVAVRPNPCAGNTFDKLALVSISQRHMWACQGTTLMYNSAVVTGMENLAADLTPTGTYHVYAKETNLYLNGSDSTGSWHDYVNYWMPFLDNQYGAYGFHDATWRPANAFGNISPYSSNASHGCVELPLATAKWLYNWVAIGTTVTIES